MLNHLQNRMEIEATLVNLIHQVRADHPSLSMRSLFYKIKPDGMGRDRFERLCVAYGFKIPPGKNYRRTTYSSRVKRFPNLLTGLEITSVNQVWVSDITYYEINERFCYITFIMDAYSRYIKGYKVSESLQTVSTTIPALRMALKTHNPINGLILHSDGGGQYYSTEFLRLTKAYSIKNSMAKEAYENPQAERVNGTIKNNYLKHWTIADYKTLVKSVDRAVRLYNNEKPHKSLKYSTPKQVEEYEYIYNGQAAEGEGSRTANLATCRASSPLVAGQAASGSDVHPANINV